VGTDLAVIAVTVHMDGTGEKRSAGAVADVLPVCGNKDAAETKNLTPNDQWQFN